MVGILGLVTPGRRHLGPRQRRGQGAFPRHRRAGQDVRAAPQARRRRRRHRVLPLRVQDVLLVRRRAALPRERQHPSGTTGPRHRRHPGRARARGDPRALRHQREDRPQGPAVRAAEVGHAPDGDGPRPRAGARSLEVDTAHAHLLNANTVPEDPAVSRLLARDHGRRQYVNSVIGTNVTPCRRPPRASRTPRRWTSSTSSRRRP